MGSESGLGHAQNLAPDLQQILANVGVETLGKADLNSITSQVIDPRRNIIHSGRNATETAASAQMERQMNATTRHAFPTLLRFALLADAAASAVTGLLLVFGGELLRDLLGLPAQLMFYAGLSLLPFAALVGYVAMRDQPSRPVISAVVAYNALWAIDSLVLLMSGVVTPTWLGTAFVAAQAAAVGMLAALQFAGLRQAA